MYRLHAILYKQLEHVQTLVSARGPGTYSLKILRNNIHINAEAKINKSKVTAAD